MAQRGKDVNLLYWNDHIVSFTSMVYQIGLIATRLSNNFKEDNLGSFCVSDVI